MSPVDIPRQRESLQYQHVEEKLCIFDQFYRIPNHAPWKYSGPGLELAVVKKLVKQIGGTIGVETANQFS